MAAGHAPTAATTQTQAKATEAEIRAALRERHVARARTEGATRGHSINCRLGRHADEEFGCANDGSSCLCECHDGTAP